MIIAIPTPELREEMVASARLHGTNQIEFHVFGGRLFDEVLIKAFERFIFQDPVKTRISVADIAVFDFLPSFIASYAIFV